MHMFTFIKDIGTDEGTPLKFIVAHIMPGLVCSKFPNEVLYALHNNDYVINRVPREMRSLIFSIMYRI